jgi:hypothetical protein
MTMSTQYTLVTSISLSDPQTILDAATATGAGTKFAVPAKPTGGRVAQFTWQVVVTSNPTCTVNLEGSNDGTNWFLIDTAASTDTNWSGGEIRFVSGVPCTFMRANVETLSGGTCSVIVQAGS